MRLEPKAIILPNAHCWLLNAYIKNTGSSSEANRQVTDDIQQDLSDGSYLRKHSSKHQRRDRQILCVDLRISH